MLLSFKKFFYTPINESLFTGKAQGNTSKLWIMRSGAVFSTGGYWHYQWALKESKMLKDKFGIDLSGYEYSSDEPADKITPFKDFNSIYSDFKNNVEKHYDSFKENGVIGTNNRIEKNTTFEAIYKPDKMKVSDKNADLNTTFKSLMI